MPFPGETPKLICHRSCAIALTNTPIGPQHGQSERIRLVDYNAQLEEVVRVCLAPGSGTNWGIFDVGKRKRFYMSMGGRTDVGCEGSGNMTLW